MSGFTCSRNLHAPSSACAALATALSGSAAHAFSRLSSSALSLWSPPVEARHLGAGGRLVDEDQPRRIKIEPPLEPRLASSFHVAVLLLSGMRRLFLNVMRRRSKKRHSVPMPTLTPRAQLLLKFDERDVRPLATAPRRKSASASMRPDLRSPPCLFAATSPSFFSRSSQRIALDALTPNRSGAWRRKRPCSMASTTRRRRSTERALAMRSLWLRERGRRDSFGHGGHIGLRCVASS
jgi:hypothetical protein